MNKKFISSNTKDPVKVLVWIKIVNEINKNVGLYSGQVTCIEEAITHYKIETIDNIKQVVLYNKDQYVNMFDKALVLKIEEKEI